MKPYLCDETEIPFTINGIPIKHASKKDGSLFYPKKINPDNITKHERGKK